MAAVTFGVADLIAVVAARRLGIIRLLLWSHVAAVVIATPYLALGGELHAIPLTHFAILAGLIVLILGALVTYYKGLKAGPVALVSPIVSAHLIPVIILSVLFLGEDIGWVQVLGIAISATGLVLASMTVASPSLGKSHLGKGVSYALLAMAISGLFVFGLGAMSQEFGWFLPIYLIRVGSLAILIPLQRATRSMSLWSPSIAIVLVAAMVGILQFIGIAAYAMGAHVGSVSFATAGFTIYPIIPIIGGFIFFHERLVPRQAFGLASVLMGLLVFRMAT
jgi:drug/metabolite transporter (DMT)-like permease